MKEKFRKNVLQKLKLLSPTNIQNNSQKILNTLFKFKNFKEAKKIGLYCSKDYEISTLPIIQKLLKEDKQVFLPKINKSILELREIKNINDLTSGKFKILEPKQRCPLIDPSKLDLIIIPCIALDKHGNRLGHGGGFYDKLLISCKKVFKICIVHNLQILKKIPIEAHDQKVDLIITEKKIINTKFACEQNKIIDGKTIANQILFQLKEKISKEKIKAKISVLLVGNDPASEIYVKKKQETCKNLGIDFELIRFQEIIKSETIIATIQQLNYNPNVTGVLIQLPLPNHLSTQKIIDTVLPEKDIDGLTTFNHQQLIKGNEILGCCTPKGIIKLLEENKINLENKKIVLIGNGKLVGNPLSLMLKNRNLDFFVCNRKTDDLKTHTRKADILISATGIPNLINQNFIKKNVIIIDAGTSKLNGKIVGDINFESVKNKCLKITPPIGGVGPMTIAMLISNTINAYESQQMNTNFIKFSQPQLQPF